MSEKQRACVRALMGIRESDESGDGDGEATDLRESTIHALMGSTPPKRKPTAKVVEGTATGGDLIRRLLESAPVRGPELNDLGEATLSRALGGFRPKRSLTADEIVELNAGNVVASLGDAKPSLVEALILGL